MIHAVNNGYGSQQKFELTVKGTDFLIGTSPPAQAIFGGYVAYQYTKAVDDSALGAVPIPSNLSPGTIITADVVEIGTSIAGDVRYNLVYEALKVDGTEAIGGGGIGTLDSGDITVPGVANTPHTINLGNIPAADVEGSDALALILTRENLIGGGGDPGVDPGIMYLRLRISNDAFQANAQ